MLRNDVEWRLPGMSGVRQAGTWRVNSTGWDAASEWAHVWHLQDGKVARFIEYLDTATVSRAHTGSR